MELWAFGVLSCNLQILKFSGCNDSDREPLRCRQVADADKQVSCLFGKGGGGVYRDVTFYSSSAEKLRKS